MERLFIALILGVLGLLTGVLVLWQLIDRLPNVGVTAPVYYAVGAIMGLTSFAYGWWNSNKAVDALGTIWQVTWKLSTGVLYFIRQLSRMR